MEGLLDAFLDPPQRTLGSTFGSINCRSPCAVVTRCQRFPGSLPTFEEAANSSLGRTIRARVADVMEPGPASDRR
jgi:hypothetical protein